jgi:hypothetical protein
VPAIQCADLSGVQVSCIVRHMVHYRTVTGRIPIKSCYREHIMPGSDCRRHRRVSRFRLNQQRESPGLVANRDAYKGRFAADWDGCVLQPRHR